MNTNLFQLQSNNNLFGIQPNNNSWMQPQQQAPWNTPNQPQRNQQQRVEGSYRAQFSQVKLDYIPQDSNSYGPQYSTNLLAQSEYKGMSLLMIRLEDYYLIRSKQIQQNHQQSISQACNIKKFNSQLITQVNQQNLIPPQFPTLRNAWNSRNTTNSNDLFNGNQTNQNPNLFQQQSNTQLFSQTQAPNQNIFGSNNNNQTNNIFGQNTSNLFQQQQQNNMQQQQPNNIFGQQGQNNNLFNQQAPNLFNNNSTNLFQQKPNLFQQQQYPQNNQNIFQQPFQNGYNMFQQPLFQQSMMPMYQSYPYQPIQYQYLPPPNSIEQISQQVNQIKNYSELVQQKFQEFLLQQEQEKQRYEQQELLLQESERQAQQFRQERERMLNRTFQRSNNQNRSISPYSKHSKSPYNSRNSKVSLNKSVVSMGSSQEISKFDEPNISLKPLQIVVHFLESDKSVILNHQFKCKDKIFDVRLYLDQYLQSIFGNTKDLMCRITNDQNVILGEQLYIDKISNGIVASYCTNILPKLTKYKCNIDLDKLSQNEAQNVENFIIENEYGQVKWITPCDLLYLDMDRIIELEQETINMYDSQYIHTLLKPDKGKKLNKECEITFKLPQQTVINDVQAFEKKLKAQADNQGIEFLYFNNQEKSYTFKVQHFSGYKFYSDWCPSDDSTIHHAATQVDNIQQSNDIQLENTTEGQQQTDINTQLNNSIPSGLIYKKQIFDKEWKKQKQQQSNPPKNISYLTTFCSLTLDIEEINFENQLTQLLVRSRLQEKRKDLHFAFKLFNVLFGNPSIHISKFAKKLKQHIVELYEIEKIEAFVDRGQALSLLLENQLRTRNQDIREKYAEQGKSVLFTLNYNGTAPKKLTKNWIEKFIYFRITTNQISYTQEWWNALFIEFQNYSIQNIEDAAFLYYVFKNTNQSIEQFNKVFTFIQQSNDTLAFLLFKIIIRDKQFKKQLKLICKSILSKLCRYAYWNELKTFIEIDIYDIQEQKTLKELLSIYNDEDNSIDQLIMNNDYVTATTIILENNLYEYKEVLSERIIPCLILEDEINLIRTILNYNILPQSDMLQLAKIYCEIIPPLDLDKIQPNNEYQHHAIQKLIALNS